RWLELTGGRQREDLDTQLVNGWVESLFQGWQVAEAKRPLLDQANERLALIADLRAAIPAAQGDLAAQQKFLQLSEQLPDSYEHSMLAELKSAKAKIESLAAIETQLKQPTIHEVKLAQAWARIKKYSGQHLVEATAVQRCDLAALRAPLILEIAKLPDPKEARGRFDQGLVKIWDSELFANCEQVKAYVEPVQQAITRLAFVEQLQQAVKDGKEFQFVEMASDDVLAKYEDGDLDDLIDCTPEFSVLRREAVARHEKIAEIKTAIEQEEPEQFLQLYDESLINRYSSYFDAIKEQLHAFITEHVVGSLRLKKLPIGDPLVYMGGNISVRWRWPTDSREAEFLKSCCVGISAGNRSVPDDPDNASFLALQSIDRDQYMRGQG
ncbi:MAG: hypothetical protein VX704_08755, partial [Verrucomicrobiota bacterium]|nr:hypothetical protein [Verrucomicrobiota bacterium]